MATTINWLTTQDIMPDFKWLTGKGGCNNIITGVNIMDNPDTIRFLSGGELILSTGYFFKNDDRLRRNFIHDLVEKKCAGLGIALKRYIDELPTSMMEEAEHLNFPIISVPFELNFAEVSMLVYREILKEEMSDTETVYEMYRKLNEIIIHEHSLRDTMNAILELTGCPVILFNNRLEFLECSCPSGEAVKYMENQLIFNPSETENILNEYDTKHFQVTTKSKRIIFPIRDKDNLLGFLAFLENTESFTTSTYNFIFSILSLLAIEFVNNTLKQQSNLQKRNNFIRNILSGSLSKFDMISQCNLYGFDYTSPRICAVIHPEIGLGKQFEEQNAIHEKFDLLIRNQISFSNQIIYKFNYDRNIILFFLFLPSSVKNANMIVTDFIEKLTKKLNMQNLTYYIGLSECLHGIHTIHSSFLEAMDAWQIGQKLHCKKHTFFYSQDIIYHILACSMSSPHLKNFYLNALKPLVEFDEQNNASLFDTLSMYFKCSFSITETAKALYIHRNTMASRLEKIKELLPSYDITNFNDSIILLLSFHAYELMNPSKNESNIFN